MSVIIRCPSNLKTSQKMKKLFFLIFLTQLRFNAIGQTEQLESASAIKEESNFKIERISRLVVFTNNTVTISNWSNGGQEALKLKIDKIVDKEYSMDGICKWYYCTSIKKDPLNGFFKTIIIVPKSKGEIKIFTFANEVTVYHTEILITKD